jgi:serine/threonine protein kinase
VRKALDTATGELVAIKILDKQKMIERGIQNNVKSEIAVWQQMDHPNIVKLKQVLASEEQIFIVLEFAAGGELFDRVVAQGKLEEADARGYFCRLLHTLDYMHKLGVCHRDLK